MTRSRWVWSAAAATALLATSIGAAAFAADEPANIVKYRKAFMGANGAHISMIAAVVKGEVSFTDGLAANAQALAEQGKLLTANLQQLFPEGTAKGEVEVDTRALPVIWERWDEFQQAAQALQQESAKLVEVAESGDQAAIAQQLGALGRQACANCHETFREERN